LHVDSYTGNIIASTSALWHCIINVCCAVGKMYTATSSWQWNLSPGQLVYIWS